MTESRNSSQDNWIERLHAEAPVRDAAIAELRACLVRGLARALTHRYGGQIDVEDVAQLALLKILDSLHSFRSQSRFVTWAMAIAVRIGIGQLRRHYYRDISLDTSAGDVRIRIEIPEPASIAADDLANRSSLLALLQMLIEDSLTDKQRVAVQGTLAGLPIEVIAARMESNRNAVYKLVHDARMRLRQGFEARGVTGEEIMSTFS